MKQEEKGLKGKMGWKWGGQKGEGGTKKKQWGKKDEQGR